jgi:hypothetical protein
VTDFDLDLNRSSALLKKARTIPAINPKTAPVSIIFILLVEVG